VVKCKNTRNYVCIVNALWLHSHFLHPWLPTLPLLFLHPTFICNQWHDLHSNKTRVPSSIIFTSQNKSSHLQAFLLQFQSVIFCLQHDC
jgi:hypothetical protein